MKGQPHRNGIKGLYPALEDTALSDALLDEIADEKIIQGDGHHHCMWLFKDRIPHRLYPSPDEGVYYLTNDVTEAMSWPPYPVTTLNELLHLREKISSNEKTYKLYKRLLSLY